MPANFCNTTLLPYNAGKEDEGGHMREGKCETHEGLRVPVDTAPPLCEADRSCFLDIIKTPSGNTVTTGTQAASGL